jgi:hypothetical protein
MERKCRFFYLYLLQPGIFAWRLVKMSMNADVVVDESHPDMLLIQLYKFI